jgi:methylmalonyl-CoA/ethylmalonyl-CoA epimerase
MNPISAVDPTAQPPVPGAGPVGARYVDHVAVAVRDADGAAAWYTDTLTFHVVHDERLPHVGVRLVYLRPTIEPNAGPSTAIQLVQPIGPGDVGEFVAAHGEGLHHVCFAVDDIGTFLSVVPGEDGVHVFRGGRRRRACFMNARPNGVLVELTEVNERYEEGER